MSSDDDVAADEDFTHVVGTTTNLDYRPHYDGPLPRTVAEAFFSLIVQVVSDRYSFTGTAVSLCLDFIIDRDQFIEQLAEALRECKSALSDLDM